MASRARPRAALLLRRRLVPRPRSRRDARGVRVRRLHRDDVPAVVPRRRRAAAAAARAAPAAAPVAARRCSSCPRRTRSACSRAGCRRLPALVHLHFHDWELVDRRRAARAGRRSCACSASARRPLRIDAARRAGCRRTGAAPGGGYDRPVTEPSSARRGCPRRPAVPLLAVAAQDVRAPPREHRSRSFTIDVAGLTLGLYAALALRCARLRPEAGPLGPPLGPRDATGSRS